MAETEQPTIYELAGGAATFERIVDNFYIGIESDPLLRPLYPNDLTDARRHMALFLMQYFGGPTTYSDERGHPRLRMRHIPFSIGEAERDAWLRYMVAAVEAETLSPEVRTFMLRYFIQTAHFMMNQ